jgi:hypothetical protein
MWRFRCKEIVCRERIRLCATRPCAKVHSAHCFPCENRVPLGPIWTHETQPYHLVGIYKDHQGPRLDSLHDSRLSRFRKTYFTLLPLSTWSAWRKLLPSFCSHASTEWSWHRQGLLHQSRRTNLAIELRYRRSSCLVLASSTASWRYI